MNINYKSYQDEIVALRRHFHMYPETAFNEIKTTEFIKNYLETTGYSVETVKPTGCTALLLKNEKLPTVILRAEMDAVPVTEDTGLEFSSKNKGAMHACGHDANMAVALVLSKIIFNTKEELNCNVRFVFEPAEEAGGGAEIMVKAGVLERPKADAFIMFHFVNAVSEGVEVNENIATAAIGRADITVKGKAGHWADTHLTKDALMASAKLLLETEKINNEFKSPYPFKIGFGKLESGKSANIVPGEAHLSGNIRACTMGDYYRIEELLKKAFKKIENETGVVIEDEISSTPITPIINDPKMVAEAQKVGKEVFGDKFMITTKLFLAGDNACLYFKYVPGIFMVFRSKNPNGAALHNPHMTLAEEYFYKAVEMLHKYILNFNSTKGR